MCHVAPGGERELAILQMESRLREEIEVARSEEHTSELQSLRHLVCRLLLEKKKKKPARQKPLKTQNTINSTAQHQATERASVRTNTWVARPSSEVKTTDARGRRSTRRREVA